MLSAGLPEHADRPSPPISDSRAAATTLQLRTPTPLPPGVSLTRRSTGPAGGWPDGPRPGRRLVRGRLGGERRRHLLRLSVLHHLGGLGRLAAVEHPAGVRADERGPLTQRDQQRGREEYRRISADDDADELHQR